MKLAALCCTYRRPHLLGQLIESFLRQTYPRDLRELVILDDDGQLGHRSGDGWRIISVPQRFHTLGEKRNACAALASRDAAGFLVADDDDIFLPHWFATHAEALKRAEWSRPSLVLSEHGSGLREGPAGGLYHGNWAYRRESFYRVKGYAALNNGEDQDLAHRLREANVTECDPCQFARPFFICRFGHGGYHVSQLNDQKYYELEKAERHSQSELQIGWPKNYAELPIERWYDFGRNISHPQSGKRKVQLIRPVLAPGSDGVTNGMYALQRALHKRINNGLDWLEIKSLPADRGALAWFWHYSDRPYANWWNDQGQPFVQGPNMLFLNSNRPRIDLDECRLLDAMNCQGMICHSAWYRDLIMLHRGAGNAATVTTCPYPIDPDPGEPLPTEYDLLIYSKNGYRPQLLEYLAERFPRNAVFHYGSFKRQALYDAARRSRACAYLADNDHGPVALGEILMAGCPAVGVKTGAAFVRDGITGVMVDRLPPGPKHFQRADDSTTLKQFCAAVNVAQGMSRSSVREAAMGEFGADQVSARILDFLDEARGS
jgi:hypothetical protein